MSFRGPGLYEFLTEAELQQYYNHFKNDLKVRQPAPMIESQSQLELMHLLVLTGIRDSGVVVGSCQSLTKSHS